MAELRRLAWIAATLWVAGPGSWLATAQEQTIDGSRTTLALRASAKGGALVFRAPDAADLFPERTGTESFWRFRVEPEMRTGTNAVFTLAYEHRGRYTSSAVGVTPVGILPPLAPAPFRIRQLDWSLSEPPGASWRHEIDRLNAQLQLGAADMTVGRQAIGWGRGVMFGAVDLFAPFSPLEADREWRRGVDAIRADIRLADRSSLDIVGAFGPAWDRSALVARARGYAGSVDVEVMAGRRAEDLFGGMTTSAAIGDAEVHGELAAFRVPSDVLEGDPRLVWKAVIGGSFRIPIGSGIVTYVEYHFSGFGAPRPEAILALLATAPFAERYLRGDMQILSRHAVAMTGAYEASPQITYSGYWLHNPQDHSGIVAPGVTYTIGNRTSIVGTAYVPYGAPPSGGVLRSEYGAASLSALLQLRLYL